MAETFGPGPKADPVEKEKVKKWVGDAPTECDICGDNIYDDFVDGCLRRGPWASMCLPCHSQRGVGLGLGKGQRYRRHGSEWIKVEG